MKSTIYFNREEVGTNYLISNGYELYSVNLNNGDETWVKGDTKVIFRIIHSKLYIAEEA